MTFDASESSQASGDPVELFEFLLGGVPTRLTNAEEPQTLDGNLYSPAVIRRSRIKAGTEQRDEVLEIRIPASTPIVRGYTTIPPGQRFECNIRRVHRSDSGQDVITLFQGLVQSVGFSLLGYEAIMAVAPLSEALSRTIPRRVFSTRCNNVLYSSACSVNNALHRVATTVSLIDGSDARILTMPGIVAAIGATARGGGTARIAGGYITPDGINFRSIRTDLDSNRVQLWVPFAEDITGQTVEVFAGCAHDPDDCERVFLNIEGQSGSGGYHGHSFIPTENVFTKGLR